MTETKKLSELIQTSYFYQNGSIDMVLKGIKEAIQENYYEAGIYINILNGIIQYNRADVLEKIYDQCISNKQVYEEIEQRLLGYSFIAKSVDVVEVFIDKGFPIKNLDVNMVNALIYFPLSTIKKLHEKSYNLNNPSLYLLEKNFAQLPANFEVIDYLLSIGLKIEDGYIDIIRSCFYLNCQENKDKIDYLYKKNIDLNREKNLLLVFSLQSGMFELIEHVLSKNIDLILSDEYVANAFSSCIRDDDIKILDYAIKKGLTFDINNKKFVKHLANADAINLFNYCIPLGLNINTVKIYAGPKLKEIFVTELYNQINDSIPTKENKSTKNKV